MPTRRARAGFAGAPALALEEGVPLTQERRAIDEGTDLVRGVRALFGHDAVDQLDGRQLAFAVAGRVDRGELDHLARDDGRNVVSGRGLCKPQRPGLVGE